jgi:peroxiredoxin
MKAEKRHIRGVLSLGALVLVALACLAMLAAGPGLADPETAPDFTLDRCVHADTLTLSGFAGNTVILFFFDAGQMPSFHAYPYLRNWSVKYRADEVVTIGIHCPGPGPLEQAEYALTAIGRASLEFPIALDLERKVCMKYGLKDLPTLILVRPGGEIAFKTSTPNEYREFEEHVQKTIRDIEPDAVLPFLFKPKSGRHDPDAITQPPTPQINLGLSSGTIEGADSTGLGEYRLYSDPFTKERDRAYLHGRWMLEPDAVTYEDSEESYLRVVYSGKEVWLLADFEPGAVARVYLKQDRTYLPHTVWGKDVKPDALGHPYVIMRYPVPVHIVSNLKYGTHELRLIPVDGDVSFRYLYFEGGTGK